jgi:hypothetical protein
MKKVKRITAETSINLTVIDKSPISSMLLCLKVISSAEDLRIIPHLLRTEISIQSRVPAMNSIDDI